MKGSETLWNEDELLTQMEQMQDQIDQMGREKDELVRVIGEKDTESSDANIRVLWELMHAGIPIKTINQGAGKLNLLIAVSEERYREAILAIYKAIEKQKV